MNTAARVRARKDEHPEDYCPSPRCLWRTGGGWCPRHAPNVALAPVAPCEEPRIRTPQAAKRAIAGVLNGFGIVAKLHARRADWLSSDTRPLVFVREPLPPVVEEAVRRTLPDVRITFTSAKQRGAA